MNTLNKKFNKYDALGVYPRIILNTDDRNRFESYKYVTRIEDWDCVLNKNQFVYELNSLSYEESVQISSYLSLNGWYHNRIKCENRIFSNKIGKFGPNNEYSFRNRNWIYTKELILSEFPWIEVMGLGYIRSTVYVPVSMKPGKKNSYDKFISLIDSMSKDLGLIYPYIPDEMDLYIGSNIHDLTLDSGMKLKI